MDSSVPWLTHLNGLLHPLLEVLEDLVAELLVEDVWEELGEVGEGLYDVEVEVAEVAHLQQERPHGRVHWLHVHAEPRDELQSRGKYHETTRQTIILLSNLTFHLPLNI